MHPHRLQPGGQPPQPAPDRRRRHPEQHRDRAVTQTGRPGQQRRRQITSAASARRSSTVTGNNTCVTRHPAHRARRGRSEPTPRTPRGRAKPHGASTPGQSGQRELPARQPGLDPNLICLYRDQRVPPCIQHGPPAAVFPDQRREGRCPCSDARHTDGADHQDQIPWRPSPLVSNLVDGAHPGGRHPRGTFNSRRAVDRIAVEIPRGWEFSHCPSGPARLAPSVWRTRQDVDTELGPCRPSTPNRDQVSTFFADRALIYCDPPRA